MVECSSLLSNEFLLIISENSCLVPVSTTSKIDAFGDVIIQPNDFIRVFVSDFNI